MNENITVSKENLIDAYKKGDENVKKTFERLYGVEMFRSKNVMERVKALDDAINELGNEHPFVKAYNVWNENGLVNQKDVLAFLKLRIITAALNEGWEPTFTENEERYCPRIYVFTQKEIDDMDENERNDVLILDKPIGIIACFAFAYSDDVAEQVYLDTNSRLCFKSEELADYASKQFMDIYADYYTK